MIETAKILLGMPVETREGRLHEEIELAMDAQQLLSSPALVKFWDTLDAKLVNQLLACGPNDHDTRYRLAVAAQTIRQMREFMAKAAENGRVAEKELERIGKGPKRAFF